MKHLSDRQFSNLRQKAKAAGFPLYSLENSRLEFFNESMHGIRLQRLQDGKWFSAFWNDNEELWITHSSSCRLTSKKYLSLLYTGAKLFPTASKALKSTIAFLDKEGASK